MLEKILHKMKRKWMKLRLQPIRVVCIHQVSETFDPESMWECDWMSTTDFKSKIHNLQKEYTFISLQDAYDKLKHELFRKKKYAVLTADDGWYSVMNVIPWLAEQNIPITLFINPLYLDGIHKQERETEKLLTEEELENIVKTYSKVSIASHGWSHVDTTKLDDNAFETNVVRSESALCQFNNKLPFYAFTYGRYKSIYIEILHNSQIVPVLVDGANNYRYDGTIHREELE